MSNKETGGAAFPVQEQRDGNGAMVFYAEGGMTLRDYFAGQALQAMISTPSTWSDLDLKPINGMTVIEVTSVHAYQIADAMLKARKS
jgi:hypothetical protein